MAPEDRRQAIIVATLPLILERGADLTTREIAQAAGVAEGTIFRAFETKQELVSEAIIQALRDDSASAQLAALGSDRPLRQVVEECLRILQEEVSRTRALTSVFFHREGAVPDRRCLPFDPSQRHARTLRLRAGVVAALHPYADQISVELETAATAIFGMAFALSHEMAEPQPDHRPRALADLVLHGIAKGTT